MPADPQHQSTIARLEREALRELSAAQLYALADTKRALEESDGRERARAFWHEINAFRERVGWPR